MCIGDRNAQCHAVFIEDGGFANSPFVPLIRDTNEQVFAMIARDSFFSALALCVSVSYVLWRNGGGARYYFRPKPPYYRLRLRDPFSVLAIQRLGPLLRGHISGVALYTRKTVQGAL